MACCGLALTVSASVTPTRAAEAPLPAQLAPTRVAGPGWNVRDLEAEKAWYMAKLGMRVVRDYRRDGKVYEYIMGFGDRPDAAILALLQSDRRPPGPNLYSRVILAVPDAKALAAHLKTVGVESREVVPGAAYFINDPEGNPIELYTPPKG